MSTKTQNEIAALLGRSVGLNADWSVDAWRLDRNHFLTDDEDGSVSLVRRSDDSDDTWAEPIALAMVDATQWRTLIGIDYKTL